jgi:hypothetical protein
MARNRFDETWHRLLEWTKGQAPSERLAAQILIHEGFSDLDPSYPLGGKDGGKDAIANKEGARFAMAVFFPRGKQTFNIVKTKFEGDLAGARRNSTEAIAFVTNQELTLGEREELKKLAAPTVVELYHLERIATILDTPGMARIREQFLDIEAEPSRLIDLGGKGGVAPSSGAGGGGAAGENARGGDGGPGGAINLHGAPGKGPGAGGGGAGAVGKDVVGGEGGGGGEYVSVALGPREIGPGSGDHHLRFRVGKGGLGGPGEDTIVNVCDKDGHVLRSIIAKGGEPGAPAYIPPPSRSPTDEDLKAGLKVTGILAAGYIRRGNDGLWVVVDGGWDWVQRATNPFRVLLPLLIEIETGSIEPGAILDLNLVVRSPDGFQVHERTEAVMVHRALVPRSRFVVTLDFSGSQPGLWRVQILAKRSSDRRISYRDPRTSQRVQRIERSSASQSFDRLRAFAQFLAIFVGITGMTVPATRDACFKVSTVGFNGDIEECANIARGATRALIGSVSTFAAQQTNVVLYNRSDRIRRDQGGRLVGVPMMRQPVDKRPRLFGRRFEVISKFVVLLARAKLTYQQSIPSDNISGLRLLFSIVNCNTAPNCTDKRN